MSPQTLGAWLRDECRRQGLTQADVAEAMRVHQGTISKICADEMTPCDDTISRLSVALGVDQAGLLARRATDLAANPRPRHSGPKVAHASSRTALDRPPPCRAEPRRLRQAVCTIVQEDAAETADKILGFLADGPAAVSRG